MKRSFIGFCLVLPLIAPTRTLTLVCANPTRTLEISYHSGSLVPNQPMELRSSRFRNSKDCQLQKVEKRDLFILLPTTDYPPDCSISTLIRSFSDSSDLAAGEFIFVSSKSDSELGVPENTNLISLSEGQNIAGLNGASCSLEGEGKTKTILPPPKVKEHSRVSRRTSKLTLLLIALGIATVIMVVWIGGGVFYDFRFKAYWTARKRRRREQNMNGKYPGGMSIEDSEDIF